MAAGTLLPCPMTHMDFLKSSHFALGSDPRLHMGVMHSTMHRDYPAHPGVPGAPPCPPPPPAPLFQQDARMASEVHESEMHCAFTPPPLPSRERERARARTLAGQASNLDLHAGARPRALLPTTRAHFVWPESQVRASEQIRGARLLFDRDSVPPGDRAKLSIPPTTYQALFPPHHGRPHPRLSCSHLGEHSPGAL